MGTYYRVFAEAKVKDKWINFNPYILDLGGKIILAPLIGYEQSSFYEAFDEMNGDIWYHGYPEDLCQELNEFLELDKTIEYCGKKFKKCDAPYYTVYTVKYIDAVKKRIVQSKPTKYEGYVDKKTKSAHQIGEIYEIDEWLDANQYKDLSPKEQIKFSYYEWDDELSWYPSFKKIERHINSMKYWFAENAKSDEYTWDDTLISDSDIRLIVIAN